MSGSSGGGGGKQRLPRHGTVRRYKAGCHCDECRGANTSARRREREAKARREGRAVPTREKIAPTPRVAPTPGAVLSPDDHAVADAFTVMIRRADAGFIEAAVWGLLGEVSDPAEVLAREVALRAARIMDSPKSAALFKSAADVLRVFVADRLGGESKDGDGDALAAIMASFGGACGRASGRGRPTAVDDAA